MNMHRWYLAVENILLWMQERNISTRDVEIVIRVRDRGQEIHGNSTLRAEGGSETQYSTKRGDGIEILGAKVLFEAGDPRVAWAYRSHL